jgi:hypothetical protein
VRTITRADTRLRASRTDIGALAAVLAANAAVLAVAGAGFAGTLLALAVAVPLLLLVVRRPQLGLLVLVALVPYDGLLAVVPHPVIAQAWKEALIVVTVVAAFVCPASARGPRPSRPAWLVALSVWLGIGLLSAAQHGGLGGAYGLKVYFFFALPLVVLWRCPFDDRERDRLVTILMVNGVVTSLVGIGQQFLGPFRLHALGYEYNTVIRTAGGFLRSFSTFDQPFGFGYFLMIVILVCLPVALSDPKRPRNQLFLLLLPVVGIALLTTIVRGAWLGVAVGIAYLGGHRYRVLLLAIPLALVALLFLPRDVSQSALSSASSQERIQSWTDKVATIFHNPLGVGIGTTGSTAERVQQLKGVQNGSYFQPDNYYFLVAYELGLLGLWWYVLLLGAAFVTTRAASRTRDGPDAAFAAGTSALVLAIAVASVIASLFQIFPTDLLFWVCLGTVATTPDRARESARAGALALANR